ncbi:ABC transporter substrate-binding protein [Cellulomonas aerilata]|uniref:Sugar ABC transporter substrate-binding protein n=1 Tax=Cellulomonas aerilata TaxID=515326 RepID=A0A512DG10_9CELL|nr:extracellular solute-binding protein [Cellulomonas aerilata]GEO35428.1 sugar ABC transporter substrate-binding protein [Cellulomonas aerilata]
MKRAPWRWSALTVAAGLALTGCASGTGSEASDETEFDSAADVSGELSIMGFGAGDEIGEVRLDEAKAAMPDVDVQLVEGDLDIQQFLSAVAAGDPPEIVYANRDQIGTFASRGAIVPLDSCIEGEGIDTSQYRESALNQVTFDDQVYGIPEFNGIIVTMANANLLSAAGLTIEDVNGSDWDAMTAATQAMTVGNGGSLQTIGVDSKLPEFLPLWAKANGVDLLSEDGRTANVNDPKVVEALEWAVDIYDRQGGFSAVKAYRDTADFFGAENQFATNTLGAMPMEHWYINVLNENSPTAPMAFDTVKDREGNTLSYATGSAWAIPADSANPEAACRLMKVITQTDSWLKAAQARVDLRAESGQLFTGLLTGNQDADEQIREMVPADAPEPWISAINAMYEANDAAFSLPANPADAEFKTAWQDAVNRVLNGQASAQESLDQGQQEAQDALDEAWATWDDEQG